MTFKVSVRVYTRGLLVATVDVVKTFINVDALRPVKVFALVAGLAPAVVPPWHVYALRSGVMTPVQSRGTFI